MAVCSGLLLRFYSLRSAVLFRRFLLDMPLFVLLSRLAFRALTDVCRFCAHIRLVTTVFNVCLYIISHSAELLPFLTALDTIPFGRCSTAVSLRSLTRNIGLRLVCTWLLYALAAPAGSLSNAVRATAGAMYARVPPSRTTVVADATAQPQALNAVCSSLPAV